VLFIFKQTLQHGLVHKHAVGALEENKKKHRYREMFACKSYTLGVNFAVLVSFTWCLRYEKIKKDELGLIKQFPIMIYASFNMMVCMVYLNIDKIYVQR